MERATASVRLLDLFQTATFRLAFAYLCLFAASVILLLAFIYWRTAGFMRSQVEQTVRAEAQGLVEQYRRRGFPGLRQILIERSQKGGQSLYLLTYSGNPIAGNISAWPPNATVEEERPERWLRFPYERRVGDDTTMHAARALHLRLGGRFELLVGRDIEDLSAVEDTIRNTLIYALGLTALFGVIGGAWISRVVLARLNAINQTSHEIISGDLTRRIPILGRKDELDQLAENLNQMLDQIERLMTGMKEVSDNIAHDLRTPLTRLRQRLEGTMMQPETPEAAKDALESAIAEADGLIATFNSLLLIAEAESGAHADLLGPVDLNAVVRDIVELYEPVAEERGITLRIDASEPVQVRGNGNLLARAAANLLENALKYTPAAGKVTVRLQAPHGKNERAVLTVSDTGPGIPEADRQRVLARFVRLERSRNTPGTGLGLSLVAAVARMHRADLELDDNHPGLIARLSFPRAVVSAATSPRNPAEVQKALTVPVTVVRTEPSPLRSPTEA